MLISWIKTLFSMMPDLSGLKELGFQVKTSHSDLYVECRRESFVIRFYQGLEPHHPTLGSIIDFEVPDGVVLVFFDENAPAPPINEAGLEHTFDNCLQRQHLWILFDKRMDFSTLHMNIRLEKLIKAADEATR